MLFGDKGKMELPKTNLEDTLDEWENQSYSLKTTVNKKLAKLYQNPFLSLSLMEHLN